MSIVLYRYDGDEDEYNEVATWHDDGTIDGSGPMADKWRGVVQDIEDAGYDPATYYGQIEGVIDNRYNNGYYRAVIQ